MHQHGNAPSRCAGNRGRRARNDGSRRPETPTRAPDTGIRRQDTWRRRPWCPHPDGSCAWEGFRNPHFHSEVQHRPFPQRGRSPSVGNGRKAWSAAPGHRGSGPGMAVVPSGCRLSGLSGRRNASAGLGRVRPGAGRAQPDRSPDGRDGEILSTPSRRPNPRRREAVARRQGGRTLCSTSAGVR